jgi:hypothetical protein
VQKLVEIAVLFEMADPVVVKDLLLDFFHPSGLDALVVARVEIVAGVVVEVES